MQLKAWTLLAFLVIDQAVYAVPENEDEALRKVFEYLKRKYSDDLSDVADTDSLPTLNPITPSLTPPPALNPITPSLTPPPVIRHATHDDLAPKNLAEPAEREEMTIDAKQITVHEKTRQSGNSRNEFHKPHALPGCDFLLNILHEAPFLPIKNDVIDYFDQSASSYSDGLLKNLRPVLEYSADYDMVALLATRKVTRLIFLERMRCPATKFDMFAVKQMMLELSKLVSDEDDSMYDSLSTMMYDLHELSYQGYDPNFLAHQMATHVHAQLFNDTIDYLVGTSLIDVEDFASYFYQDLKSRLPEMASLPERQMASELQTVLADNIMYANVHCPTAVDVSRRHLDAVWDMTNGLKEIETYGLCMQIRDYLKQYVILPNHMTDSQAQNYNGVMSDICDFVRDYVQKLLTREIDYQKMIASRDALALKEFFQHYLTEDELTVLANVLEKLHWIPNFPVTEQPLLPDNLTGEFLPKTHVISNELQDIDFWKSYLDTMTLERFQAMDITDFKESIRRWLKEKEARLDVYYNLGSNDTETNATGQNAVDSSHTFNEQPIIAP